MVPFIILALMLGVAKICLDLREIFRSPTIQGGLNLLVTNILSMFIVMELLRSLIEYFEIHRLKITFIIDGVLVFILREIMIGLYQSKMNLKEVLSLSFLLLVVGIIRTLAILFSPKNIKEL
ncbi:MAG: phosphate-starvation-inducible PsiE family protein [Pseudomonadota bacterium]